MYGMVSSHQPSNPRHGRHQAASSGTNNGIDYLDCNDRKTKSLYRKFIGCIRQTWTGVKQSLDSEFDDLENPVYRRPKSLEHLISQTRFSRAELKRLYRRFKAECPSGLIREETFRSIYAQFFPRGGNGSLYFHYVFNSLMRNDKGFVEFEDLVIALSDLCRGSADEKLRWAFQVYDIDGDGIISRSEMERVATSICELTGINEICLQPNSIQLWVDRIFEKMDLDGDGVINADEFVSSCIADEQVAKSLLMFDNYQP